MPRIQPVELTAAQGQTKEILDSIRGAMGGVPAMFSTIGHSPATLRAMWGFFGAMSQSRLPGTLREQIALAVGQANDCGYCLAAHSALGKSAGLKDEDILSARRGSASDPRAAAALRFAAAVLERKGHVSDSDVAAVRAAGHGDAEILEIVAVVVQNIFTNWINHVTQVTPDFPVAPPLPGRA